MHFVHMPAGHGHLVVATAAQCHIYATNAWNTAHIFDLQDTPHAILQCARSFMLLLPGTGELPVPFTYLVMRTTLPSA